MHQFGRIHDDLEKSEARLASNMHFKVFADAQYGVERGPHVVGDGGGQHFEKVVLQLQLRVLDEVRDALDHDHLVWAVLEQDLLGFEGHYLLVALVSSRWVIRRSIK